MSRKVVTCAIGVILVIVGVLAFYMNKSVIRPNTSYVGIIHHNEVLGIDAITCYTYYIYPSENDTYLYVKSREQISEMGSDGEKDISSGKINSKSDFEKIKKDIEKDKIEGAQQERKYIYLANSNQEICNTIEELADKLFVNGDEKLDKRNKLSQDYVGDWYDDESLDTIKIYSINDDKVEFEWSVYRTFCIDKTVAILTSDNKANFNYKDDEWVFEGVITFENNEISLELIKAEGMEYISSDYKTTFNIKTNELL